MSAKVFLNMPFFELFEIRLLPVVFELALVARDHRIEPEIHRAHVERGDLRLEGRGRPHALLDRHGRRAAGGDVHHHVGALLDHLEERREGLRASDRAGRPADCARADARSPRPPRPRRWRHRRSPARSPADAATSTACGSTPVTAQVMMTLRDFAMSFPPDEVSVLIGDWTWRAILEYQPYRSHPARVEP